MHRHEWEWVWTKWDGLEFRCHCNAKMSTKEIVRRLNATEMLSAVDAKFAYRNLIPTDSHAPNVDYSLRAYIRALEDDK